LDAKEEREDRQRGEVRRKALRRLKLSKLRTRKLLEIVPCGERNFAKVFQ
jgi:hypothetical protein